jgi:Na+-driven multidrug efflux pump
VAVSFYLNRLGVEAVAAFNAGQKIEQFGSMPLNSYGQAMTTFAAQNYGARKYGRIRTGVIQGSCVAVAFSIVMGAIFILFGNYFTVVFIKDNLNVMALTHTYLKIVGSFLVFLALLFTFRQVIQGLGNALIPTISGVTELVMRVLAAIFLTSTFSYTGLCFASPLAWIGCLVPLTIAMVFTLKRLRLHQLSLEKHLRAINEKQI